MDQPTGEREEQSIGVEVHRGKKAEFTFCEEAFFRENRDGICEKEADIEGRTEKVDHDGRCLGKRMKQGCGGKEPCWLDVYRVCPSSRHRLHGAHHGPSDISSLLNSITSFCVVIASCHRI